MPRFSRYHALWQCSVLHAKQCRRRRLARGFYASAHSYQASKSDWSSTQYLKFEDERTVPVKDLLAKVPLQKPLSIVDLGCGPGNSTAVLLERYPDATIVGMDSSEDMLRKARLTLPNIEFIQASLEDYMPSKPAELLFSNAVFHWLRPVHRVQAMERLLQWLQPGGVLAIQMPDNYNEPSHTAMRKVAAGPGPWSSTLNGLNPALPPLPPPREFYDRLGRYCSSLSIWRTRYCHILNDHAAIAEWVKGTGLRPFIDPLGANERDAYLKSYLDEIRSQYPPLVDGRVMLEYPRLFIVAVRGEG